MGILSLPLWAPASMPQGLETHLAASLWRAAAFTDAGRQPVLRGHHALAEERLPICQVISGQWSAGCWTDETSIARRFDADSNHR
eukprot:7417472-Pyramimonas_sp.AAC.1